jgi:hypothetical protein
LAAVVAAEVAVFYPDAPFSIDDISNPLEE